MISSIGPRPTPQSAEVERVAEQFESHFLSRLMSQMHGDTKIVSGFSGSMYQGMLDEKLAESLAHTSPLGIRDMLVRELSTRQKTEIDPQAALGGLQGFTHISSGYGMRKHPISGEQKFHHGLDLPAQLGASVHVARAGRVSFSGTRGGYGEVVEVRHDDGTDSIYAHLSQRLVSAGERVDPSRQIGLVGSTGASTGPHLHFEVQKDGKSMNPTLWLTKPGLTVSPPPSTPAL